jgi:diacylglycerol kinase (ATP)
MSDGRAGLILGALQQGNHVEMNGWLAIVNRHSGGTRTQARLANILKDLRCHVEKIVFTEHPGHATELARMARSYSGLAIVGGDGTLFEILKGLDRKRQRVALVPVGRGNSLARDLGLLGKSLSTLNDAPQHIDLMEVTCKDVNGIEVQHSSASTVALGYPAAVAKTAGSFSRCLDTFCYVAAAALVRPVPFDVELLRENGSRKETRLKLFIASNTRHLANFRVFPEASCRDGFIDLLELDSGFFQQSIHNISGLFGSTLFRRDHVSRAKSIGLRLQQPQELLIDGEIIPDVVSIRIRIMPMALACIHRGVYL